jgi:thiamine biosynthesis lipoprotein
MLAHALQLSTLLCLVPITRCSPLERHEYREIRMGVEARVVLYAASEAEAVEAARAAFDRMAEIEDRLSDWRETSEARSLCERAGGPPIPVSGDLWSALARAAEFSRASDGAFDVTCGPLVSVWRAARRDGRLPAGREIDAARARSGWTNVRLDAEERTVALALPGMQLDFGAIGQGFACDEALAVLTARGIESALCEISGDIAVSGPPPGEDGWRIAVGMHETPMTIVHAGVASSGDTEQFMEIGGVRYSHIVDPRSGNAVTNGLCCSVIASDATTSDALATAACVVGADAAEALVEHFEGARLIVDDPSFRSLFDGKSLDGWVTKGGRYDGNAAWTVEDGALTGRIGAKGEGGLIYTAEPFTSFELELDTKIDYPFDSGIFLRMVPPEQEARGAQVTLDYRSDGEIGAIYADEFLQHNTTAKERFKKGEWNQFRVRCTGFDMHIQVWMNGEQIADYTAPEGTPGFAPRGLIGLQVHGNRDDPPGNKVQFRNIKIRTLPVFEETSGWKSLLGESDASAWEAVDSDWATSSSSTSTPNDYTVEKGVLAIPSKEPSGYLRTKEDFADFRLKLEFKLARMANSGLFLRGARDGSNPAYSGCEIQLLDDFNWEAEKKTELKDWQFTGSLYGAVPAGLKNAMRPIGEWNSLEVLYRGTRIAVALNGVTLYDVDTTKVSADPPFAKRTRRGFIGLQRYAAPNVEGEAAAWVRNVFVQRL